jgi:putative copper resistance protein D
MIYIRAVHFAATLVASGLVFFVVFVAVPALRAAADDKAVRARLWPQLAFVGWFSLVLAVGSGAAWLVLTASSMSGTPPGDLSAALLTTVLTQTHFGLAAIARLAAAGVLAMTFALLLSPRERSWIGTLAVLAAAAFSGALAFTGHAIGGQGAEGIVHPAADILHLIAAAAWIGALLPLALLLAAAGKNNSLAIARAATLRFSALGVISVGTLLVTGIVNTWYLAGSIEALTSTFYGQLLLAKIATFLVMVAIAAVNRQYLTPRLMQNESAHESVVAAQGALRQLRRNALIEALAGFAVICMVAVLGTKPPGIHIHQHPAYGAVPSDAAFIHIHTEQAMADVTIQPGHPGEARVTIRLWNGDFEPIEARAVKFSATSPGGDKSPERTAREDADGAWQVDRIELSQPGNWMVTVDAQLTATDRAVLAAPIVIEAAH